MNNTIDFISADRRGLFRTLLLLGVHFRTVRVYPRSSAANKKSPRKSAANEAGLLYHPWQSQQEKICRPVRLNGNHPTGRPRVDALLVRFTLNNQTNERICYHSSRR